MGCNISRFFPVTGGTVGIARDDSGNSTAPLVQRPLPQPPTGRQPFTPRPQVVESRDSSPELPPIHRSQPLREGFMRSISQDVRLWLEQNEEAEAPPAPPVEQRSLGPRPMPINKAPRLPRAQPHLPGDPVPEVFHVAWPLPEPPAATRPLPALPGRTYPIIPIRTSSLAKVPGHPLPPTPNETEASESESSFIQEPPRFPPHKPSTKLQPVARHQPEMAEVSNRGSSFATGSRQVSEGSSSMYSINESEYTLHVPRLRARVAGQSYWNFSYPPSSICHVSNERIEEEAVQG